MRLEAGSMEIFGGLVVGKFVGILGAAWCAERIGLVRRPAGVTWGMVSVVAALGGIGFNVAILVAELALGEGTTDTAKTPSSSRRSWHPLQQWSLRA